MFSGVWSENAAPFERFMKINSNPPILYYGFNLIVNLIELKRKEEKKNQAFLLALVNIVICLHTYTRCISVTGEVLQDLYIWTTFIKFICECSLSLLV